MSGDYSDEAIAHLDALWLSDHSAYDAALDACDLILNDPARARAQSSGAIAGDRKMLVLRLQVVGHAYLVYWTTDPPRVEAVLAA